MNEQTNDENVPPNNAPPPTRNTQNPVPSNFDAISQNDKKINTGGGVRH